MNPDFQTLKARIEAIAALGDGVETILAGKRCNLRSATLSAVEALIPQRVTRVFQSSDRILETFEWPVWEYVVELCSNDDDEKLAGLAVAAARVSVLPLLFARHPRLQLNDSGLVWRTELMTSSFGSYPREDKEYIAIVHILPITISARI